MNFDFSLILVILCTATGAIWLIDHFVFAKPRFEKLLQFLAERKITKEGFQRYLDGLAENSKIAKAATDDIEARSEVENGVDPARETTLQQAAAIHRDPLPVEYAKSFFPILFVVLILRSFLLEPFQIPSGSMIPTLNVGDFIVVNKFAYGLRLPVTGTRILDIGNPQRGDVMVFVPPHDPRYFIKRVIGLPGDHIRYANNIVYVNSEPLLQHEKGILQDQGIKLSHETIGGLTHNIHTYVPQGFARDYEWLDIEGTLHTGWLKPEGMVVPEGQYFMMGDNRDGSEDSRYWGPASDKKIVGKALAVWMHKEPGWHLPTFGQNRLIENAQ
ncbi:MAG: signal peptidase I [Pseudomonadota bacterium]